MPFSTPSPSDFSRLLRWTLSTPTDLEEVRAHVPMVGGGDRLPRGERVVVRADLDVPIEDGSVVDKARLSASAETLRTCIERGCRAVVLGHLGRSGGSLRVVATELGELVGSPIRFVDEWLDESSLRLTTAAQDAVAAASEGTIVMFDNVRRYEIEQRLWKADIDEWAGPMHSLATHLRETLGGIYVNEAIAASNRDFSSAVLPLAMDQRLLGSYIGREVEPLAQLQAVDTVVMGGIKADKLDDLERMCERPATRLILVSGTLALVLRKAQANLAHEDFELGRAGVEENAPYYAAPVRIRQAEKIIETCVRRGLSLVLPVDFILDDGTPSRTVHEGALQLDVGPDTRTLFDKALVSEAGPDRSLFYNGVAGKFEDARFAGGTQSLIKSVERFAGAGGSVYVGGGEGRSAFLRFADHRSARHVFTAGGTVLKAVAGRPLPMLNALLAGRMEHIDS